MDRSVRANIKMSGQKFLYRMLTVSLSSSTAVNGMCLHLQEASFNSQQLRAICSFLRYSQQHIFCHLMPPFRVTARKNLVCFATSSLTSVSSWPVELLDA